MPQLLCNSSIRLIESGVEYLSLSIETLRRPIRIPIHDSMSYYSIPTGLLGISIELICSSIMIQTYGEKKIFLPSGQYKSAGMILDELKKLLKYPIPKTNFLVQGIIDKNKHYEMIYESISELAFMLKIRASAVHAARSPSKEVIALYIQKTLNLLQLLAKSNKISPYLTFIPSIIEDVRPVNILIDDLIKKVGDAKNTSELSTNLVSLFLVLPEIPEYEPEWISAIERISVAPKENDIAFLLSVLGKCKSVNLVKNAASHESISVNIDPGNPAAIPIDPHYIKKEFTKEKDRFYADIANANGRLKDGKLDLPPVDSVLFSFSNGIESIDEKFSDNFMTPHEAWPFIAASFNKAGTPGPYWYFIKKTDDKAQLKSLIERSRKLGNAYYKNEKYKREYEIGLKAIMDNTSIDIKRKEFEDIYNLIKKQETEKSKLEDKVITSLEYSDLVKKYKTLLIEIANNNEKASTAIQQIIEDSSDYYDRISWVRFLTDICDDIEDADILYKLLNEDKYKKLSTNIRKAYRLIDFLFYGPSTSWEEKKEKT